MSVIAWGNVYSGLYNDIRKWIRDIAGQYENPEKIEITTFVKGKAEV